MGGYYTMRKMSIFRMGLILFLLLGVWNGSAKAVYTKAANICTECVGLG